MSRNNPVPQFPSTQPTERGLMPWLRQLASWGRGLSRRLQSLEDAPPSTQVFTSYNWNDPDNQPDKPPQDGDGYGWSRFADKDATWMSQKVAPSLWEGEWGAPVLIRGRDGHSTLRVAILADPGTVFQRDEPGGTADPTSITLSLSIFYGAKQIAPADLSNITWTYPDGSTASTETIDVVPSDISGESEITVEVEYDGITATDEITLLDVAGGSDSLYAALDFDQLVFKYTPSGTTTNITPTTIQGNALAYLQGSQVTPDSVEWQHGDRTSIKSGSTITVGHSQSQVDSGTADAYVDGELHLVAVISKSGKTVEVGETLYDASDGAGMSIVFSDCPVTPSTPSADQSNWAENGWYNNVYDDTGSDYSHLDNINWRGAYSSAPSSPAEKDAYRDTTDNTSYIYYGGSWQQLMDIWRSEKKEGTSTWSAPERVKGEKGDKGTPGQNTYTAYYFHTNQYKKPATPSAPQDGFPDNTGSTDDGWYYDQANGPSGEYIWFISIKGSRHEPGDSDWPNDSWSEPIQIRGERGTQFQTHISDQEYSFVVSGENQSSTVADMPNEPMYSPGYSIYQVRYDIKFSYTLDAQGGTTAEGWILVDGNQVWYEKADYTNDYKNGTQTVSYTIQTATQYPHDVTVKTDEGDPNYDHAHMEIHKITAEIMTSND